MEKLTVTGGRKLYGKATISSAKNSVLPLVAASVARSGVTFIGNCPKISDVFVMMRIVERLGGKAFFRGNDLVVDSRGVDTPDLPEDLTVEIRASFFFVGALITRFGRASACVPGGCRIGKRPVDIHISALKQAGISVRDGERIFFDKTSPNGGKTIELRYPSVGATENAVMACLTANGTTVIKNAAMEPEITDLAGYLNLCGCKIKGAGSPVVTVEGVGGLYGGEVYFTPVADRIEAGTFMLAAVACGGKITFDGDCVANSRGLLKIIGDNACKIYPKNGKIEYIEVSGSRHPFGKVVATPYPGFATDLQPQLVAAACAADGMTVVADEVFPERFGYVGQLLKTGVDAEVFGNSCVVVGNGKLHGADMTAGDLRGGAAMIIAALCAEGRSVVRGLNYIDRGYESIEKKFSALGAEIARAVY